jgi:hypothetical protein
MKSLKLFALAFCATSVIAAGFVVGVAQSDTLTYHFTNCAGPTGTPTAFDATKQLSQSAALHVTNSAEVFVAVEAVDAQTGAILFTTPGFENNVVPTISCQLVHPVTGQLDVVTGFFAPVTGG